MRALVMLAALAAVLLYPVAAHVHVGAGRRGHGSPSITLPVNTLPIHNYTALRSANRSTVYRINAPYHNHTVRYPYVDPPYLVNLKGGRFQIGYDYAALMATEASESYVAFLTSTLGPNRTKWDGIATFATFLWGKFYAPHVPQEFLTELEGMKAWAKDHPKESQALAFTPDLVSIRYFILANMPADAPNIVSGLEHDLEHGWPAWLKRDINNIIDHLLHLRHGCDAFGVWGSRTQNGRLYSSRNLDYNANTGINKYKLIIAYNIDEADGSKLHYTSIGFTLGLGALAGMNKAGITTSEMNLDNSETTYNGLPFPLRLRYVLEKGHDLHSAMAAWNATNNTNSFNFLIASAPDTKAYALETMRHFTAEFPDNSPIERAATYNCHHPPHLDPTCHKWAPNALTNASEGKVPIGFPLPEAVWRTNHGMNPRIMATQEPLFNDTIFRYNLMHDLFVEFEDADKLIDDEAAVGIVATLGTKGRNYFTCDERGGSNVLSVLYVPGEQRFFVAWELGSGSAWHPAACAPYLHIDMTSWWSD